MKNKDEKITIYGLKVNEELFEAFDEENFLCVNILCYKKNDKIYKKYIKYCNPPKNSEKTINCTECWKKFLTEDLIKIRKYDPSKIKIIIANKEISTFTKCENIINDNKNKIMVTVDGKEIFGPCTISILTKKYNKQSKVRKSN